MALAQAVKTDPSTQRSAGYRSSKVELRIAAETASAGASESNGGAGAGGREGGNGGVGGIGGRLGTGELTGAKSQLGGLCGGDICGGGICGSSGCAASHVGCALVEVAADGGD